MLSYGAGGGLGKGLEYIILGRRVAGNCPASTSIDEATKDFLLP